VANLWKTIGGEPYMINPRLGLLALQALNPKRKKKKNMAKRHGARHMAWVRSHRKSNRRRRRSNPYPMAGTVAALANPRRRRRHSRKHNPHRRRRNPGALSTAARGMFGLPPLMPVVYGFGGFVGTAMIQGFVDTLVPVSMKTNADGTPNMITKYVEIAGSILGLVFLAKQFVNRGAAAMAGVGGGIYLATQVAHDFAPGVIPGMHAYTPMKSYTPLRPSSTMGRGMARSITSAGGGFPGLAAPDHGAANSADFAANGGMNLVGQRFRRFA
jgi:hypothetical protein